MSRFRQRLVAGDARVDVDLTMDDGTLEGTVDGQGVEVHVERAGPRRIRLRSAAKSRLVTVVRDGDVTYVSIDGDVFAVRASGAERAADAAGAEQTAAASPMTGVVVKVHVSAGDEVAENEPLFVVEAMKMEYVVRAPRAIVVADVSAEPGQSVELGEVLVTFAAESS